MCCTESDNPEPLEMLDNFRYIQLFNGRLVFSSFHEGVVVSVVIACTVGAVIFLAIALWLLQRKRCKNREDHTGIIYKPGRHKEEEISKA